MLDVVVIGDPPSLHGGFATVGREVTRALRARGARVRNLGRDDTRSPGRLAATVGTDAGTVVLSVGGLLDHAELLEGLRGVPSCRPAGVVVYLPVDAAPLPPVAAAVLDHADLVVPYTMFGAQALELIDGSAALAPPVPHGVDTATFAPVADTQRRDVRGTRFGLTDQHFLVGFFGRNCGHKRPDLALRAFAAWVQGDTVDAPRREVPRLYMHTELLTARERRVSGGWDLELLARRLGIEDLVVFDPSLRPGRGVPDDELARRMAACDVHLLPYEGGAWELTVLETAACGVPNVITDAAAPPEYAAPFSVLVPPAMRLPGPRGARAFIDLERAAAALHRLHRDHALRDALSRRGIEVAQAHRWELVGDTWWDLLLGHFGEPVGTVGADVGRGGPA